LEPEGFELACFFVFDVVGMSPWIVIAGMAMQSLWSALSPMPICNDRFSTKWCKKGACGEAAGFRVQAGAGEEDKVKERGMNAERPSLLVLPGPFTLNPVPCL
jgi:hypothetical protein